jgi:hypothetical protein
MRADVCPRPRSSGYAAGGERRPVAAFRSRAGPAWGGWVGAVVLQKTGDSCGTGGRASAYWSTSSPNACGAGSVASDWLG